MLCYSDEFDLQAILYHVTGPETWDPAYCTLRGTQFRVYDGETDSRIMHEINIETSTQIKVVENDINYIFSVQLVDGKQVQLMAYSKDIFMEWILALTNCTCMTPNLSMTMFDIISVIGRGHYAKVMLCQNHESKEYLAIKSIQKSKLMEKESIHTVVSERNILTRVHHPFIINIKFAFQSESKFYLGLEYAAGGELFTHLTKVKSVEYDDLRLYIIEIALALNYLHKLGIIYRDLKAENVLLDSDGHIKLTDFGLSKILAPNQQTSTFCGTAEYLAPEMIKNETYSFAVDWWTLGILVYEMFFGKTPFYHANKRRLYKNITTNEPMFKKGADEDVKSFITMLLRKNPAQRGTFEDIENHQFLNGINFEDVLYKRISPSYKPNISDKSKAENFDPQFTEEEPTDSAGLPTFGPPIVLPGFSFDMMQNYPTYLAPNSFDRQFSAFDGFPEEIPIE